MLWNDLGTWSSISLSIISNRQRGNSCKPHPVRRSSPELIADATRIYESSVSVGEKLLKWALGIDVTFPDWGWFKQNWGSNLI
jgi:hypothetical protein